MLWCNGITVLCAARQYGARRSTYDIDIAPSMELGNLQRLSAALRELGAGIRVDDLPDGLPSDCSRRISTRHADAESTHTGRAIDSVRVKVAALDDVIVSEAAPARGQGSRCATGIDRPRQARSERQGVGAEICCSTGINLMNRSYFTGNPPYLIPPYSSAGLGWAGRGSAQDSQ